MTHVHQPTPRRRRLLFSYEILTPAALSFFVNYADGAVESLWSIDQYFEFVLVLMLSTGLSFQVRAGRREGGVGGLKRRGRASQRAGDVQHHRLCGVFGVDRRLRCRAPTRQAAQQACFVQLEPTAERRRMSLLPPPAVAPARRCP